MAGPLEHAALGNNSNGAGPFDVSSYEALKHRVQQLKREQQSVAKGRAASTEVRAMNACSPQPHMRIPRAA